MRVCVNAVFGVESPDVNTDDKLEEDPPICLEANQQEFSRAEPLTSIKAAILESATATKPAVTLQSIAAYPTQRCEKMCG